MDYEDLIKITKESLMRLPRFFQFAGIEAINKYMKENNVDIKGVKIFGPIEIGNIIDGLTENECQCDIYPKALLRTISHEHKTLIKTVPSIKHALLIIIIECITFVEKPKFQGEEKDLVSFLYDRITSFLVNQKEHFEDLLNFDITKKWFKIKIDKKGISIAILIRI